MQVDQPKHEAWCESTDFERCALAPIGKNGFIAFFHSRWAGAASCQRRSRRPGMDVDPWRPFSFCTSCIYDIGHSKSSVHHISHGFLRWCSFTYLCWGSHQRWRSVAPQGKFLSFNVFPAAANSLDASWTVEDNSCCICCDLAYHPMVRPGLLPRSSSPDAQGSWISAVNVSKCLVAGEV